MLGRLSRQLFHNCAGAKPLIPKASLRIVPAFLKAEAKWLGEDQHRKSQKPSVLRRQRPKALRIW